jgi:hypothetical protein
MNIPDNIDEFLDLLPPESLRTLMAKIQERLTPPTTSQSAQPFNLGDQVTFKYQGYTHFGTVIRINKKTISVAEIGNPDGIWKAPPRLLSHIRSAH